MNIAHSHSPPLTKYRILIASGNPLDAQALESLLRATGYAHVRTTTDPRQVPALFHKWRFDLLILDARTTLAHRTEILQHLADPINAGALSILNLSGLDDEPHAMTHTGKIGTVLRPLNVEQVLPRIQEALAHIHTV